MSLQTFQYQTSLVERAENHRVVEHKAQLNEAQKTYEAQLRAEERKTQSGSQVQLQELAHRRKLDLEIAVKHAERAVAQLTAENERLEKEQVDRLRLLDTEVDEAKLRRDAELRKLEESYRLQTQRLDQSTSNNKQAIENEKERLRQWKNQSIREYDELVQAKLRAREAEANARRRKKSRCVVF